ncbi:MAG: HNH endonuclease family protein [Actinomycetota bacterium]
MSFEVRHRLAIAALATVLIAGCGAEGPRQAGPAPTNVAATPATNSAGTETADTSTSTADAPVATTTVPTTSSSGGPLALELLGLITVENEHTDGYDRTLFAYPSTFAGGCNTREMVLKRDSLTPAQVDPFGCKVVAGDWLSLYDGLHFDQPGDVEIDHVVALKEAWDSGAWQWSASARTAYANDLVDVRTLRAVSMTTNRSKSDKDPSNWLPPDANDVCRYVGEWVAIKARWNLSMDDSEYGRIRNLLLGQCAGWRVDPIDAVATGAPAPSTLPAATVATAAPTGDVYYATTGRFGSQLRKDFQRAPCIRLSPSRIR